MTRRDRRDRRDSGRMERSSRVDVLLKCPIGLQLPPEKMVGMGLGGLTTEPEDMFGALGVYIPNTSWARKRPGSSP